ncbi:MAG TPA: response regulator transcription factor [Anaerolineae bacterium]|jgi:DNA-binding response OmpR family regulator|nr:response regulator transcription factor [Anaerolineae bacterium]
MRVLVVEDEHKIANSIKRGLEQEAYAVDVVYDGESGFGFAITEDYDAIILDLMLPKMDGVEVCKKLRQSQIHTPILMLTAKGLLHDKVNGLNAGADDYLVKPFAFAELVARVRALARRPKESLNPVLTVENLSLNTFTYEVVRSGKRIDLSKKEFALLEYLMRNKSRVITKDQIINHVWDYDADILPNTVEVYIGYLRNKIDKPFRDNPILIHTVRGFGYKIGRDNQ